MKSYFTAALMLTVFSFQIMLAQGYTWTLKMPGNSLGDPIDIDKLNSDIVYYGTGNKIYRSTDRGETFAQFGNDIPSSSRIKNIIVHHKDSQDMLVAVENSSDRIVKTSNRGKTWETVANNLNFSFFGIPMTPDPSHPDTIYTMSGNQFMRSTNFGDTWSTISNVGSFDEPCDIEVFPDSSNIILVGDNLTGIFRSSDYGLTWTNVFSTTGEIPTIATDANRPGVAWASRWGSGGGFLKSTNYGLTWTPISFFSGKNMWGTDVAPENSDFVMVGQYSGGLIFLSKDDGNTWSQTNLGGNNYSIVVVDTNTIFAAQSTGLYKINAPYIPVELISFSSSINKNNITLEWETATEVNNSGFEIEQSFDEITFKKIGFVAGFGTTTEKKNYSYKIHDIFHEKIYFRLKQIDLDGSFEYSKTIEVNSVHPVDFRLAQNYPNPFNPSTTINFQIPAAGFISLKVYDILGNEAAVLVNGEKTSGNYEINFDASGLSSGLYFYQLKSDNFSAVRKMVIIK